MFLTPPGVDELYAGKHYTTAKSSNATLMLAGIATHCIVSCSLQYISNRHN